MFEVGIILSRSGHPPHDKDDIKSALLNTLLSHPLVLLLLFQPPLPHPATMSPMNDLVSVSVIDQSPGAALVTSWKEQDLEKQYFY